MNPLAAKSSQFSDFSQYGGEVVGLLLCLAVINTVVSQTVDDFHLDLFHLALIFQSVSHYKLYESVIIYAGLCIKEVKKTRCINKLNSRRMCSKYLQVTSVRASMQASAEMSKDILYSDVLKSAMEFIQSPKISSHCFRWRTVPSSKMTLSVFPCIL